MNIKLSKRMKITVFTAVAVVAFAFGLFLECCDKKDFVVTEIPTPMATFDTYPSHYDDEGRLDINAATANELCDLYGIGEKLSVRIIDYRETNGGFSTVEEIKLVPGIGDELLEKLKDRICVK